eukprot:4686138-Pyramimonas_sp.AAC.1
MPPNIAPRGTAETPGGAQHWGCELIFEPFIEQGPTVPALLQAYHEMFLEPKNMTQTTFLEHKPDVIKQDNLS